ncbi:MAG: asparaginase [Lachnospiraceae bacterium]|nr:asparaginase [Lachnospiraceae bacterium]
MKRILLLTTGGTIASVPSQHGLSPSANSSLLDAIPELGTLCHLTVRQILNLDSTNLQPEDWKTIANEVFFALPLYDGIIITHGTDTMAYTASALSYMINNLEKPVILTGSQLPITAPGTDAKQNLWDAILTALSGRPGVHIVFHSRILDGRKSTKIHSVDFNAFAHADGSNPIGYIKDQKTIFLSDSVKTSRLPSTLTDKFCTNIALFQIFPGFSPDFIIHAIDSGVKGIIINGYGSGNVPGTGRSILPALQYASKKKIPVILGTQCTYGGCSCDTYEVGSMALQAGALSAGKMSTESTVVLLMMLLGKEPNYKEIPFLWQQNQ